jgi:hypothetical protein
VARLDVPPAADETLGLRVTFTVSTQGVTVGATFDVELLRKDRAVASVNTTGLQTPFPEADRVALVKKVADRMAA